MYNMTTCGNEHKIFSKLQKKEPTALLQYQVVSPGTYELYHTEVPPEFRGKGIAKVIAK